MSGEREQAHKARCDDVRLRGFASRVPLERAVAWVEGHAAALPAEAIPVAEASGRVAAVPVEAPADLPPADCAGEDGYALRSRETLGAGAYNPLPFAVEATGAALGPSAATLVVAGEALPPGADAVLSFGAAERAGARLEVYGAVAEGVGVERRGRDVRAGTALAERARVLRPQDAALLARMGVDRVQVVERPRVRLVVAGPKRLDGLHLAGDAIGPMLSALVARDGGVVDTAVLGAEGRSALGEAMATPGDHDVTLVVGRTGTGPDDVAPLALADVGELVLHGVALRPGGSAGLGWAGGVPVVLLPGEALACLCVYELLAGRLIRLQGGHDSALPHPTREAEVGRKIVSAVGLVEVCQVRWVAGRAEPVGSPEDGGLATACRADGFVVIPASLEGHAPGTRVTVYLY
jgi:molybdopterin molybdotransferase